MSESVFRQTLRRGRGGLRRGRVSAVANIIAQQSWWSNRLAESLCHCRSRTDTGCRGELLQTQLTGRGSANAVLTEAAAVRASSLSKEDGESLSAPRLQTHSDAATSHLLRLPLPQQLARMTPRRLGTMNRSPRTQRGDREKECGWRLWWYASTAPESGGRQPLRPSKRTQLFSPIPDAPRSTEC